MFQAMFVFCARYAQGNFIRNICARFDFSLVYAQDSTSFVNAQDMHKICARYAQDLRKILLLLSDFG